MFPSLPASPLTPPRQSLSHYFKFYSIIAKTNLIKITFNSRFNPYPTAQRARFIYSGNLVSFHLLEYRHSIISDFYFSTIKNHY